MKNTLNYNIKNKNNNKLVKLLFVFKLTASVSNARFLMAITKDDVYLLCYYRDSQRAFYFERFETA